MSCFLGMYWVIVTHPDFGSWRKKTEGLWQVLGSKGECGCGRVKALFCLDISEYSVLLDSAYIEPSRSLNQSELNFFPTSIYFLSSSCRNRPSIYAEFLRSVCCRKVYFILCALIIDYKIKYILLNYVEENSPFWNSLCFIFCIWKSLYENIDNT